MNYDEYIHTKDIQMLKSILPVIDVRYHYIVAVLIQVMEFIQIQTLFSKQHPSPFLRESGANMNSQEILMELIKQNIPKEELENIEQMEQMMQLMFMNMEDFTDE